MEKDTVPMFEDFNKPVIQPKMNPNEAIQYQLEKRQETTATNSLSVNENGVFDTSSLDAQKQLALRLMSEGLISETFKTPQQVILGIQYCKELNIPILVGMKMLYVVNGKPSLYGDGPLSLCQRSGEVEFLKEFFIDEAGEEICFKNKNLLKPVFGAVTQLKRSGDKAMQEDYFTVEDLARAGIDKNKYGKKDVWKKFERNMLRYKARSMSLRTKFADMMSGVNIAEYHDHFDPTTPEILVTKNKLKTEIESYGNTEEEENKAQEITQ